MNNNNDKRQSQAQIIFCPKVYTTDFQYYQKFMLLGFFITSHRDSERQRFSKKKRKKIKSSSYLCQIQVTSLEF